MATVTPPRQSTDRVARVARRSLWLLRELPVIPLLVLAMLTFVAILAPVLAPHSKLDPVKPTKAQCMAPALKQAIRRVHPAKLAG